MFDHLLESSRNRKRRGSSTLLVSVVAHTLVVAVILLIPLIYYQSLPDQELVTFLAAPAPPPPPPPPPPPAAPTPQVPQKAQVVRLDPTKFTAPTEIPKEIPPPSDEIPIMSSATAGVVGGVPGGVPGGIVGGVPGGVVGGVLGGFPSTPPPPPPPVTPKEPVPVGGDVQNSKLVRKVLPDYPELAKRARVYGIVLLQVTVDETGSVAEIKLVRGHPLLSQAAIDAVRQWKYSPTLLNGEPVPVIATVTVNFVLH